MKIAVLDDYCGYAHRCAAWAPLRERCAITVFERHLRVPDEAAAALADFDILCLTRERMAVPAALIASLPKLRFIAATGTTNRTLDLAAATERGVPVSISSSGEVGAHATPEMTWGLLLALARHIPQEDQGMRRGGWQATVGIGLHGRTLGLLGLGKVGSVIAGYGRAFGMQVIAWSPHLTAERAAANAAKLVSKEELFASADIVSIHLVLGEGTCGLVGKRELSLMKPSALLVNTSRGPIVDEEALRDVLVAQRIGGAALDVFDAEPLPRDHPLRFMPNTVLTPHLGYCIEEIYEAFHRAMAETVVAFLDGRPTRLMNPDVLGSRVAGFTASSTAP